MSPRSKAPATAKNILVLCRPADQPDIPSAWHTEPMVITSFTVTPGAALMLLYRGRIVDILAPGTWGRVTFLDEEPLMGRSREDEE